ncbi:hypothetical protein TWF225_004977 [Orbilia oligospora]|uniref:Uncharacterized protein n=1 Tax=Orbilia oligospora TaxID=2813651 RepID=A0A8H2DWK6_ORBOL|nr:hypothetical protein TWF225_004977 [Orbilia oligospora]KAF3264943.1 hypothetical protein TWF217_002600 [Orbilia oligospora]KAF3268273.1 hypothetical protein TWF128_008269 [Orbilia oligospora]TGJ68290.1 hypothetical protein EYR41_007350 [Orbilia oligospora]
MRQLLSDSEPELDSSQASIIFTPVASDSDFDELLESESLGDRSTTSTVPTQNSQRSQRWMSMSQMSISTSTSQYADMEKIMAIAVEERDAQEREHNRRAFLRLKVLIWTCAAVSIIWTLYTMGSLDSTSLYRCSVSSGQSFWDIKFKNPNFSHDRSLPCPTHFILRILKKGKILSKNLFPNYYPPSDGNVWMGGRDRMQWPEYPILTCLFYIANFKGFMSWGLQLFALAVIFDTIFLRNLARILGIKWIVHKFTIRDLYLTPLLGFFTSIPWGYLLPHLLGISGMIDSDDRRSISSGLQYLVVSWVPLRGTTRRWRSTSFIRETLWGVYSLFCALWLGFIVYMNFLGGNKVEVKMFEARNKY